MEIYTYNKLTLSVILPSVILLKQLVVSVLQSQLAPVYPTLQLHSPRPVSLLQTQFPFEGPKYHINHNDHMIQALIT